MIAMDGKHGQPYADILVLIIDSSPTAASVWNLESISASSVYNIHQTHEASLAIPMPSSEMICIVTGREPRVYSLRAAMV